MKTENLGSRMRAAGWRQGMALLFGVMLGGCQSSQQALRSLAADHGHQLETIASHPFPLVLSTPLRPITSSRIRIYIEGDGHAWATRSQPSLDPTPRQLLVASLAFDDPNPSLYLARPCQFLMATGCRPEIWTTRRFSEEVTASLDQALDQIKARYGNRDFELIGYSGGAALALLLAGRRDDIGQLQTLAGNLSPRQWVQLHQLSPLTGSLSPDDYRTVLARIPQRHLAGGKDKVVPPLLIRSYIENLEAPVCVESEVIADASHADGWTVAWRMFRNRPLHCEKRQVE